MLKSIIPRDEFFFDVFDKVATNVVEGAKILGEMIEGGKTRCDECAQRLRTIEHQTDEIIHESLSRLHKTFITPIDRDDIHRLLVSLDDILDLTEAAASRLNLYLPEEIIIESKQLTSVLMEDVRLIKEMVNLLRQLKNTTRILDLGVEINRLENDADLIRRGSIARLFREKFDPLELIKWKEIMEHIEEATDRCEDVADITERIVLENT